MSTYDAYFAQRRAERERRVLDVFEGLNPRERRLVQEAAVMGYVRGARAGEVAGGYGKTEIPDDQAITHEVVSACLHMSELYPVMVRVEGVGSRRRAKREESRG